MNYENYKVVFFDSSNESKERLLSLGNLLYEASCHDLPEDPQESAEQRVKYISANSESSVIIRYAVWENEKCIAYGRIVWFKESNPHRVDISITVHPDYRRQGIGSQIYSKLLEEAKKHEKRVIIAKTNSAVPSGVEFARSFEAEAALTSIESRLEIDDISAELLQRWQTRPAEDQYVLRIWKVIPEEYLERMADMIMCMNNAPIGDLDKNPVIVTPALLREWKARSDKYGKVGWIIAAEHIPSGRIDSYTQVQWLPLTSEKLQQAGTAVRPEVNGIGLGKWVKAAMIDHIKANIASVKWIATGNATSNVAMLGLNTALGFKPWREEIFWQLKI